MYFGIDNIAEVKILLKGHRVGLITNHSGVNKALKLTADLLSEYVCCLFGPEHGVSGVVQDELHINHSIDPYTKLPVYSLFGDALAPTMEMLDDIDTLVFDIQDIGVRFYTYTTTMIMSMEAAYKYGKRFIVLDRINPLGRKIEGLLSKENFKSFLSYLPVTTRHGMTAGELALMIKSKEMPGLDLNIVKIQGLNPNKITDDSNTNILWVPPSPNMPTRQCAWLYPGTCLVEGTSVSEGRGTTKPFELIGAPWLDARQLAIEMNNKNIPGVLFRAAYFTPVEFKHKNIPCQGVQIHVTEPQVLGSVHLGIELIRTLQTMSGDNFTWRYIPKYQNYMIDLLHGDDSLRQGVSSEEIYRRMEEDEKSFQEISSQYYLYE